MSVINSTEDELNEGTVEQWDTRHIDQVINVIITLLDSANLHQQLRRRLARTLQRLATVAYHRLEQVLDENNFSPIISSNALSFYENIRTKCLTIIRI